MKHRACEEAELARVRKVKGGPALTATAPNATRKVIMISIPRALF
jgi:hypothetical protein